MTVLLLAAVLQSPLAVDTVRPIDGPPLHVHRQAGPLVAIRLSVPVPVELPEGSVELLQELARPAVEAAVRPVGGIVVMTHARGRAAVTVTGPRSAFDALVVALRRATAEPDVSLASLRRARTRAEDRVLAGLEQPAPRIRRLLRHRLYGGSDPTGPSATLLDPEGVRTLRDLVYARDSLTLVLVGDVAPVVVRSAFRAWPAGSGGTAPTPGGVSEAARPQAHRQWAGVAVPVDADPAVLAVTARLIQDRGRRSSLLHVSVQDWHDPAPGLVLVGAAAPGDSVVRATADISRFEARDSTAVPEVGHFLRRLVAEAAALAGPEAVAVARDAVRRGLLLEARTVTGKAALLDDGIQRMDGGDPAAYLTRLKEVDLEAVQAVLTAVLDTPAVVAGGG